MYIVIVGGGKVGFNLTKFLLSEGHEVLLIEKDKVRAAALSDTLNEAVLEGNGSRVSVLQEAGSSRANVLIAVTGDDEDNLVICQVAKVAFKCPRTIARVNDPNNEFLFSALGVDATVNATRLIDALIEEQVKADNMVIPLVTLGKGVEIIEIDLTPTSRLVGQSVAQIQLPEGAILIAILRGEEVVIPQPKTVLEKEDKVVALVKKEVEQTLREMF
jgi:trk system potassium uptake protein TrkA